jgi:hypothetical protein
VSASHFQESFPESFLVFLLVSPSLNPSWFLSLPFSGGVPVFPLADLVRLCPEMFVKQPPSSLTRWGEDSW